MSGTYFKDSLPESVACRIIKANTQEDRQHMTNTTEEVNEFSQFH